MHAFEDAVVKITMEELGEGLHAVDNAAAFELLQHLVGGTIRINLIKVRERGAFSYSEDTNKRELTMSLITALMVSFLSATALASDVLPSGVYENAEGTSILLTNHGTHVSMVTPQMPNAVIEADFNGNCRLKLSNHQIGCVVRTTPHTLTVSLPAYEITSTARYVGEVGPERGVANNR